MRKIPALAKKVIVYMPSLLAAFAAGLLFNAYYQAAQHYEALMPRGQIAVFLSRSAQTSHQIVGEKIKNIEGVAGAVYVSQDKVLETAMKDSPALREVLITGDNPFTSYFQVEPKEMTFAMAQWIKNQMAAVEGVEDIRFDATTFNILDRLGTVVRYYGGAIQLLFTAGFLMVAFKYFLHWMHRLIDYRHVLRLLGGGVAAGVLGAGIYYLLGQYAVHSPVVQVPGRYFVYMVLVGILTSAAGDN